ncbi:MAG: sugar ABC transporter permease [Phycisphaeraceae bacterium]|nr:sugar ABC transporter permease [Phycisphaeraceae bacterium]
MRRTRRPIARFAGYLPLLICALAALLPLYWLLTGSVRPAATLLEAPPLVPTKFSLEHFRRLFSLSPAGRWLLNSIVLAVVTTLSNVILCSMAGYGFARLRFMGRRTLFWICLCTMMVPVQVTVIPLFLMVRTAGLMNTYVGLALPTLATAFGIFLMKQFIQTIPGSLIEAARIDGCHELMIFWRIVFPISIPAVTTLGILTFTSSWNGFLWPLLVTIDNDMWTMPVGLGSIEDNFFTDYGLTMAGAAVAAIPMIMLFLGLQRFFLKGLTIGAVKG